MLKLTRHEKESITIGDNITVNVIEIQPKMVLIGIEVQRHENESITIGDNITVNIIKIWAGVIRLGIEAPRHVSICRDDAINRKKRTDHPGPAENKKRSAM